jgi:hypothetical protein
VQCQHIAKISEGNQALELVVAVGAAAEDLEEQVQLRVGA